MYIVKETPKDRDKKKKNITIIVVVSSIALIILIVLLIILLLLRNRQNNNNNKVKYQVTYDTALVTDVTSLDNKGVTFTVSSGDNKYNVSIKLDTSTSNASIGSYTDKDYMYSIYDGHPNTLDLIVTVKDNSNNNNSIDISDITYTLYLGNKDGYTQKVLDKNTSTYSGDNLISIYKLDVEFYIG